jgi:hypothetical protein
MNKNIIYLHCLSYSSNYAIRKVQENHERLELNETRQILAYADHIMLLDKNTNTSKRKHRNFIRR